MPRVLIITNHRKDRSPGQRFRFEQYLSYLESKGFTIDFSYFLSPEDDKILYAPGNYLSKLGIILKNFRMRAGNCMQANNYDIIFIFREATLLGTAFFEKWMSRSKAKLIFDFDDAIWVDNVSNSNKSLAFLKNAAKTADIIKVCDMVFAGNEFLAEYARKYCNDVRIIPTTIDTDEYKKVPVTKDNSIVIGWTGSITTIQHFEFAIPFLTKVKEKYGDKISIKVVGDGSYVNEALGIQGLPWRKETELADLSAMDIGIMPLPNDEWAKGKCGLKGLQYMSLGIPTIMSPVGVNADIIQDGQNGFLAEGVDEWLDKLSRLIEDASLREKMGHSARQTVIDFYSVESTKDKYLSAFNHLLEPAPKS